MRIFFDTEFTGLRQDTTLISIGCVSEDGKRFYAELDDFNLDLVDAWIKANVTDHLWIQNPETVVPDVTYVVGNRVDVAAELRQWFMQWPLVEVWSDVLAYDWVLFCQLFGGPFGLPLNIYYIPFDLATLLAVRGVDPDVNREEYAGMSGGQKHNALWDAMVIQACYLKAVQEKD
jgi:hypothetical protein